MLSRRQIEQAIARAAGEPTEVEPVRNQSESSCLIPADAPEGFFKNTIEGQDRKAERSRKGASENNLIHATSALDSDFCPRENWIMRDEGTTNYRSATGAMRIVWALGRAAETHVRNQLLAQFSSRAVGRWSCDCGSDSSVGLLDLNLTCSRCGSKLNHYNEESVEFGGIVGNADFVLQDDDGREVVFEVKSMKKEHFESLQSPLPDHIRQAKTYIYLRSHNGRSVDPRPRLIYVAKDYSTTGVYKEFRSVSANLDNPEAFFRAMLEEVSEAIGESIPSRLPVCPSVESPRAKRCSCVSSCFLRAN